MSIEQERVMITTVRDLATWLSSVRHDLDEAERGRIVEALRTADHPRWGTDWGPWLAKHHELVDDAVGQWERAQLARDDAWERTQLARDDAWERTQRLKSLRTSAVQAGDAEQVRLCDAALQGDADALAACLAVIRDHENGAINVHAWARDARVGDYLARFWEGERDPGSRCGWADSTLHEIREVLRARGLDLHADDVGLRVSEVSR